MMVLINNAYLGLIRQAQRAFKMDYEVQLASENINAPEIGEYGVDHVKAADAFGCRAVRVFEPEKIADAIAWARSESETLRVSVIVEVITERVTNIAMGAEIDAITEFEEVVDLPSEPRARYHVTEASRGPQSHHAKIRCQILQCSSTSSISPIAFRRRRGPASKVSSACSLLISQFPLLIPARNCLLASR